MIVKELLTESILNLNLNARDPKVLSRAVSLFNGIMRRYSGNNVMTAYQNSIDFEVNSEKVNVGKYGLKDGYRDVGIFVNTESLPDVEGFYRLLDIAYVLSEHSFYTPSEDGSCWEVAGAVNDFCTFFPDVLCADISDVVSVAFRTEENWKSIQKIPFANFWTDTRHFGYSTRPIGENKVELLLKGTVGKSHKVVYTTSMKFDENSILELPEIYLPLVNAALTEDLGNAFPAVDETIVNKYRNLRERLESDIMSKNMDDRMIVREDCSQSFNINRVDMWM